MTTVALLDANVLIPNALCDFLLRLAEEDLYQPRWSASILDEVRRHVPVPPAAIDRRIAFMNAAFDDALVTGYGHASSEPYCGCSASRQPVPAAAAPNSRPTRSSTTWPAPARTASPQPPAHTFHRYT